MPDPMAVRVRVQPKAAPPPKPSFPLFPDPSLISHHSCLPDPSLCGGRCGRKVSLEEGGRARGYLLHLVFILQRMRKSLRVCEWVWGVYGSVCVCERARLPRQGRDRDGGGQTFFGGWARAGVSILPTPSHPSPPPSHHLPPGFSWAAWDK